jgi:hypothetical protein
MSSLSERCCFRFSQTAGTWSPLPSGFTQVSLRLEYKFDKLQIPK